jgi:hypothetical protein
MSEKIEGGEWFALAEIVNHAGGLDDSEHMRRYVIDELRKKRLRFRYCFAKADGSREPWRDDLPEHFWHGAKVNWIWSHATFGSLTVGCVEVMFPDGTFPAVSHAQPLSASTMQVAKDDPIPRTQKPKKRSIRLGVKAVAAALFPNGLPPELSAPEAVKKIAIELKRRGGTVPSDDTIKRAIGRR